MVVPITEKILISGGGKWVRYTSQDDISFTLEILELVRLTTAGYAYFGSYPTTHTVAGGSPIKKISGLGVQLEIFSEHYGYIGFFWHCKKSW